MFGLGLLELRKDGGFDEVFIERIKSFTCKGGCEKC